MSEWKSVKLGELYEVHNGLSKGRKFFGSGYPFLSFSTVFNNYFIPDELTDLVQTTESERNSYSIHRGDIFVTRTSETSDELGMSCVALKDYPDATYNGFTKRMRPITDRVLPEYIGYYMRMPSFRGEFQAFSTMTTRASLKNEDLLSLSVCLPSLDEQNRIAQALLNYDNLIENNQKQIKLLEEAAQRLYKEWFVDQRFPGYEDVQIVDGVPEGWTKEYLGNCMTIKRGGSPRPIQSYLAEKGLSWLKISDASSSNGFYILDIKEHIKETGLNKTVLLKAGSLVLSNSATPGIPKILDVESCIHDGWLYFENSLFSNEYLLLMFLNERDKLVSLGTGAVFTNLKTDIVKNYPHIVPPKDILNGFQTIVHPIFLKIRENQRTNRLLSEARDRLLPKLMSGEIEL